jgi:hypothetical protein
MLTDMKYRLVLVFLLVVASSSAAQTTTPDAEMSIDQLKKTVVFIEGDWDGTQNQPVGGQQVSAPSIKSQVGTGFLIFIPEPEIKEALGITYLVTAKHMIRQSLNGQPGAYLKKITYRYNLKTPVGVEGRQWKIEDSTVIDDRGDLQWLVDSDPEVDIALVPIQLDMNSVDFRTIPDSSFGTKQVLKQEKVNENDEVLFTGLFSGYFGSEKNYPIVRHGRIALIPNETVALDSTDVTKKTDIYFVDVMSFGGNSGSPVFLRLGGVRETTSASLEGYKYYLLGVMRGFVADPSLGQNSGVALVVPVDKIQEILSGPQNRAVAAVAFAKYKSTHGDMKGAEQKFKEAIATIEPIAPESSLLGRILEDYATFLQTNNRPLESQQIAQRAVKIMAQPLKQPAKP